MVVIVGGIIVKDNKVLLVQEAKKKCYGKWNIPAGRLELNESILSGAIREIKEETGCDVELTGILNIASKKLENETLVMLAFMTRLLNENITYNKNEILDVKWFDIDYVLTNMDNNLRDLEAIKKPIINYKENNIGSINLVSEI